MLLLLRTSRRPKYQKTKNWQNNTRVVGGFLIHLYRKCRILGEGPAARVVTEVLSGSNSSGEVVYGVGKTLRDRLIYACTYQPIMHLCAS